MNRAVTIALREVRAFFQDRGDLAFSLLLPIAIFALMYGAFGGSSTFHGTVNIVNQDTGGEYSDILLQRLSEIDVLSVQQYSAPDADNKLARSSIYQVYVIPAGFSDNLTQGKPTSLISQQRGNGGQEGQIVASIVRGVVEGINAEIQVHQQVNAALAGNDIPVNLIDATVQKYLEQQRQSPAVSVKDVVIGTNPDPVQQFLPGIITMFVLFAITLSARAIVEERRKGTLERLLTTRLTVSQLFFGKFLANGFRAFLQTLILLLLAYAVFRIFTPLSFLYCMVIAMLFAAATSALGLLLASVARTEGQGTWLAVLFTMLMTMLGGTFFSVEPGTVFYTLGKFSINTYANQSFKAIIANQASLASLGSEILVLAGVAAGALIVSRVLFRAIPGGK